jgi:hypothetical protein
LLELCLLNEWGFLLHERRLTKRIRLRYDFTILLNCKWIRLLEILINEIILIFFGIIFIKHIFLLILILNKRFLILLLIILLILKIIILQVLFLIIILIILLLLQICIILLINIIIDECIHYFNGALNKVGFSFFQNDLSHHILNHILVILFESIHFLSFNILVGLIHILLWWWLFLIFHLLSLQFKFPKLSLHNF